MSIDPETLAVYEARAEDYAKMVQTTNPGRFLKRFMHSLPQGARVLDLGCGPGDASAVMLQAGFDVDPVDASPAMIAIARDRQGLPARLGSFDDITQTAAYHGVWANFSLLHAPRTDLPGHLAAIRRALVEGGSFHIGLKLGDGEERDSLGRFYTYYTRDELAGLLAAAGFEILAEDTLIEPGLSGVAAPGIHILTRTIPHA